MARAYGPGLDVRLEEQTKTTSRSMRSPQHPFLLQLTPWMLQPCVLVPVLPGETMKNATFNARIISEPIRNAVTGWWAEFYLWYVRLADLEVADVVREAIIDPTKTMTSINKSPVQASYMHMNVNYPSWVYECLRVITRAYFRDEGEEFATTSNVGGHPMVAVAGDQWHDSLIRAADVGPETGADDWEKKWSVYQNMRRAKLTTNTFEEWLAKYGVAVPPQIREAIQDFHIPELVRFVRDFVQPQTTVDPATGLYAATVQWNMAERMDKRRFFDQPGWLFGCIVLRPKSYLSNHRTTVSDILLSDYLGWLPPEFETDPHTTLKKHTADSIGGAAGAGPVHKSDVDYFYDARDLYLRGEQYLNFDTAVIPGADSLPGAWNLVDLPTQTLINRRYPTLADAQRLFTTTNRQYAKCDGIFTPRIASRVAKDTTY